MKVLFGLLYVGLLSSSAFAQTRADSLYHSLLPISWSITFHNTAGSYWTWSGTLDSSMADYPATLSGDTVSVEHPYRMICNIDTSQHLLRMFFTQEQIGLFNIGPVSYVDTELHLRASAYCTNALAQPMPPGSGGVCDGGWVYIGGAKPQAWVSRRIDRSSDLTMRQKERGIQFSFTEASAASVGNDIHIFDMIGHDVMRLEVPPGVHSFDLNTSSMVPGIYIAQFGTEAVTFANP